MLYPHFLSEKINLDSYLKLVDDLVLHSILGLDRIFIFGLNAPVKPSKKSRLLTLSSWVYDDRQPKTFCVVSITCRRLRNPWIWFLPVIFSLSLSLPLHSTSWRFDRTCWEISQQHSHVWPVQDGIDRNRTTTDYHVLLGKFIRTTHTFT